MKKDIAAQEIKNLIEVIKEQQDLVLSHDGLIPQIELDILMGNVRKLYENLIHLSKQNTIPASIPAMDVNNRSEDLIASTQQKVVAPPPQVQTNVTEAQVEVEHTPTPPAVAQEIVALEATNNQKEAMSNNSAPSPTASIPQPEIQMSQEENSTEVEEVLSQTELFKERTKEFTKPAQKSQMAATLFDDTQTVSQRYAGSPTLYDKISTSKEDKSIATKLQKNPVTDLKKSIGINEKFAFINELFDGDLNAYNNAVEQLNSSSNHGAAITLLENEFASNLGWSIDGESYIKLKDLIDRRFTS